MQLLKPGKTGRHNESSASGLAPEEPPLEPVHFSCSPVDLADGCKGLLRLARPPPNGQSESGVLTDGDCHGIVRSPQGRYDMRHEMLTQRALFCHHANTKTGTLSQHFVKFTIDKRVNGIGNASLNNAT